MLFTDLVNTETELKVSPLSPHMVNWYISFLFDRKQRLVYNGTVCDWMMISKGIMQGSVSRPHLFNLFLDDLETDSNLDDVSMVKYADSQGHPTRI